MIKLEAKTIPHTFQRCAGNVGDYWTDGNGVDQYRISDMDWVADKKKALILEYSTLIHEIVENFLLKVKGIQEPDVQKFDEDYYKNLPKDCSVEAGDAKNAPYRNEHTVAEGINRILFGIVDMPYIEWEEFINQL